VPRVRGCQRLDERETVRVKNLNGAVQNKPSSGSWLRHWEEVSGQNAWMCFVQGCIRRPIEGGRVQKDSGRDQSWYVIPLCTECHGKHGQDLDIWDAATLVPATERAGVGIRTEPRRAIAPWTRKADRQREAARDRCVRKSNLAAREARQVRLEVNVPGPIQEKQVGEAKGAVCVSDDHQGRLVQGNIAEGPGAAREHPQGCGCHTQCVQREDDPAGRIVDREPSHGHGQRVGIEIDAPDRNGTAEEPRQALRGSPSKDRGEHEKSHYRIRQQQGNRGGEQLPRPRCTGSPSHHRSWSRVLRRRDHLIMFP
jgi:hypothetical protein